MNNLSKILSYSTLSTIFAFFIQIVSANILSINDYGVIAKWLTDLAFLSIFFVFGLDNALLYFSKKGSEAYSENFYKNIYFFSFVFLILSSLSMLTSDKSYYFSLILACYLLAIIQSFNAYNLLNSDFNKYGLVNLFKNLIIFLIVLTTMLITSNINVKSYMGLYVSGVVLALIITVSLCFKPRPNIKGISTIFSRSYFGYGFQSMMNTLFAVMLYSSTVYVIDYYSSKEEVALFFTASVLSKLAWVVPDSVGNLLYPKYLKMNIDYNKDELLNETYFFAQINLVINLLAIGIFLLIGRVLITLLYGEEYIDSFWVVVILLVGNQGMVYYKIIGRFQAASNEWRTQKIALISAISCNILLNFLLIEPFGLVGAATATAFSFWLCGIVMSKKVQGSFKGFLNIPSLYRKLTNGR